MKIALKIGGSVLQDEEAYTEQAKNISNIMKIYNPSQLFVVVSAMKGMTDYQISRRVHLIEDLSILKRALEGKEEFLRYEEESVASFILQPEIESAYLLRDNIMEQAQDSTLETFVLEQGDPMFPVIGNHSYLSAVVDMEKSYERKDYLDQLGRLVIVSGFGAVNNIGEKVLLGRNATDVVAAMIGRLAGVDKLVYVKDVPGIFDCYGTDEQRKLNHIYYSDAVEMDINKVLDKRVFELLKDTSLDLIIGHHENMIELLVSSPQVNSMS